MNRGELQLSHATSAGSVTLQRSIFDAEIGRARVRAQSPPCAHGPGELSSFETCFRHNSVNNGICLKRFSEHGHGYRRMNRGELQLSHATSAGSVTLQRSIFDAEILTVRTGPDCRTDQKAVAMYSWEPP